MRITEKGQVTIPGDIRRSERLLPGTEAIMQMLQVTIGITANKAEDKSGSDLMVRARESLPIARRQVGAGIYMA